MEEIQSVVFNLCKDSSHGPDTFGGFFYQTHWSIVQIDVSKVVMQLFNQEWILPNFNVNTIIIIPKKY